MRRGKCVSGSRCSFKIGGILITRQSCHCMTLLIDALFQWIGVPDHGWGCIIQLESRIWSRCQSAALGIDGWWCDFPYGFGRVLQVLRRLHQLCLFSSEVAWKLINVSIIHLKLLLWEAEIFHIRIENTLITNSISAISFLSEICDRQPNSIDISDFSDFSYPTNLGQVLFGQSINVGQCSESINASKWIKRNEKCKRAPRILVERGMHPMTIYAWKKKQLESNQT